MRSVARAITTLLVGCSASETPIGADLPGETILLLEELGPPVLTTLDPTSAGTAPWFTVPSGGFAYDLDVYADGTVALAYTAPAIDGGAGYDRSRIVRLWPDAAPETVAGRDASGAWCFFPVVTSDTARVWFVTAGVDVGGGAEHALAYVDTPGGAVHEVVPWATEPAVSPDGTLVAWVAVDPETLRRSLVLGDTDGTALRTLIPSDRVTDIGQPFFSADGDHVYVVVPTPAVTTLWGALVPRAEAHGSHDVPGDWWRVPTAGGDLERVTDLETLWYDGRAHPGGRWFAAATREGVVLVDLESGVTTTLLETRTVRALDWIP